MPLSQGSSRATFGKNVEEFHGGKTFAKTKKKYGAKVANKQALAVAYSKARKTKRKRTNKV
jgi:hypothetical protein